MIYKIALYRGDRRQVIKVEADSFDEVLDTLTPFLSDDSHTAHETTAERVVREALLRTELYRAEHQYAVAREKHARFIEEALDSSAERPDPHAGPLALPGEEHP